MFKGFSPLFHRDMKIDDIRLVAETGFEIFENATDGLISSLEEDLEEAVKRNTIASKELKEYLIKNPDKERDSETHVYFMSDSYTELWALNDQLDTIAEMKVIYLFKNLESVIKQMFVSAYPTQNVYDLYRIDNLNKTSKSLGIELKAIEGYAEFNQLRVVNNNIKHSKDISEEVKRIAEFKKATEFDHESVTKFYDRVKTKIVNFSKGLSEVIITNAFEFSDDRLKQISLSHLQSMDKATAIKFIEIFSRERKEGHEEEDLNDD